MELTRTYKRFILMIIDVCMIYISGGVSYYFLSEYIDISDNRLIITLAIVSLLYISLGAMTKVFSIINRYTDYQTLAKIAVILLGSHAILLLGEAFSLIHTGYRFILLNCVFTILFTVLVRLFWRIIYGIANSRLTSHKHEAKVYRTLVVGAGDGGNLFLQTVLKDSSDLKVVALVDADRRKLGSFLHGVKVVGLDTQIPEVVADYEIEQIVIAIPSLHPRELENILNLCRKTGVKVSTMPKYEDVIQGHLSVSKLREIEIADLLGRKEVVLNRDSLVNNIQGKTIMVTGAGGSIGSEICRQLAKFNPERIVLLGHGENSIYLIHKELTNLYKGKIELVPVIADIQDRERIFSVMKEYRPSRVYHAAAHKHVPLMEYNPTEAVKNNIYGTRNVAEAAKEAGVEKFVMISTDKAVNPPNVMGATKRVAEMIVTSLNEEGKTLFSAVRFGNVLGSRGSVVPLFKEQIAKGGPVTVTDFRMTRYFMTIPEASRLVIQAGALMKGGEIFVLDMGEPVKILDLAKKMISLSGYTEEEIEIVESGVRPGEKLYEVLLSSAEKTDEQVYEKIFVGKVNHLSEQEIRDFVTSLSPLSGQGLKEKLVAFAQQ